MIGAGLRHDQSESSIEIMWLLGPTSCKRHEYIVVTTSCKVNLKSLAGEKETSRLYANPCGNTTKYPARMRRKEHPLRQEIVM